MRCWIHVTQRSADEMTRLTEGTHLYWRQVDNQTVAAFTLYKKIQSYFQCLRRNRRYWVNMARVPIWISNTHSTWYTIARLISPSKHTRSAVTKLYLSFDDSFCVRVFDGYSLKRKSLHFDEMFITGCTGSCQNDNFQCSQWWKFRQNDDIFVSVLVYMPCHRICCCTCEIWLGFRKKLL